MNFVPEPYQLLLRDHLYRNRAAAGFVGLGLGKTATALSAITELACDGDFRGALVVAPVRVARLTWPNEIRKWDQFKWMRYEILQGQKPSGRSDIYLINYERLHELRDLSFCDTVVFDELTRAKNPKSERINALRPLLGPVRRRWGLTGTPRPNSVLELYAQIRLLDDGKRLGPSSVAFRKCFCEPTDWNEHTWTAKPGAAEIIYQKIHDLCITLKSSDYLNIPDTVVEDVDVPLPAVAHALYRQVEKELYGVVGDGGEILAPNAGALAIKLHQVAGGTVYDADRNVHIVHDAKISALKKLLKTVDGNAIIFTSYRHERERVCAAIGGTDASRVTGDIENLWNTGALGDLVADPRSMGHGLNLQAGGRTVIWYSPHWSRELYDQANARVARKGQTEIPIVYRLVCPGTIDDAIVETLRTRGDEQHEMLTMLSNWRQQGLAFAA